MAVDITELIDKLPPLRIPYLHSNESIGIDLGSSTIKIVQLKGQPGKYQLVRWSVIPLVLVGEGDKSELSPEEKANAITVLKTYRGSGKGIPKSAVTSISGNAVIVRYVKFQKLTRKELSKTIKAEAEPYIPFNIEEVYIGFHPLHDVMEEGKQKMETVLVAAKKDYVSQRIEILEETGFKPAVIDVDAFTLESVYESTRFGLPADETVLIANMGYSKTNFVIVEKGISMVVKDSPVAGNAIGKAIMKNLGVDFRTSEKLKNMHGILMNPEERDILGAEGKREALGVSDAIVNTSRDLATEIKKIIQYFITQGKDKRVNRVLITGGCANIKNLVPFLGSELNLPIEKLNPFQLISGAEGVPQEYQSTMAVAVGLAMRKPGTQWNSAESP